MSALTLTASAPRLPPRTNQSNRWSMSGTMGPCKHPAGPPSLPIAPALARDPTPH